MLTTEKMEWVAYVGPFMFPWGQPGSRRVFGIASALVAAGYRVVVGSGQWGGKGLFEIPENPGIFYSNVCDLPKPGASAVQKLYQLFYESGTKTVEWLESMQTKPASVFVYGAGAPFMARVGKWCQKNNVPIVSDVVEWYDPSHMTGGFFGPFHVSAKVAMHHYFPRCNGIVAISSLLEEHYNRCSDASVVRVPPIFDVLGTVSPPSRLRADDEHVKLVYAGTPGKKDLLGTVIEGVARVDPMGRFFRVQVIGPSIQQVKSLLGRVELPLFVDVLGRLPQEAVAAKLQEADFSVLLRESKRFANAGFSTKFVESLVNGTPVIANYTSDLRLYLQDGIEGIVCGDHSVDALADALRRVMQLSREDLSQMRVRARERALSSFDYRAYADLLGGFVREVSK